MATKKTFTTEDGRTITTTTYRRFVAANRHGILRRSDNFKTIDDFARKNGAKVYDLRKIGDPRKAANVVTTDPGRDAHDLAVAANRRRIDEVTAAGEVRVIRHACGAKITNFNTYCAACGKDV